MTRVCFCDCGCAADAPVDYCADCKASCLPVAAAIPDTRVTNSEESPQRAWRILAWCAVIVAWLGGFAWILLTPEPSWYAYHHAFNERWYSGILRGEVTHPRLPPGYAMAASFLPLGPTLSLRLVSFLSCGALVAVVWAARGERVAALVASLPFLILWGTRAQTDAMMTALAWIGILTSTRFARNFTGGFMVGLSAFVKPTGLLAAVGARWRFLAGAAVGSLPFALWMAFEGWRHLPFHAAHGLPFANLLGNMIGLAVGFGGAWGLLRPRAIQWTSHVALAAMAFGAFALAKAPLAHQYYLLPALVGLVLLSRSEGRAVWMVVAVNATLGLALITLLSHSGGWM